jgi:subtilase-type serine protease
MKSSHSFLMLGLLATCAEALADADQNRVIDHRQRWFEQLRDDVLTHAPRPDSDSERMDRLATHHYRSIRGPRHDLARKDRDETQAYLTSTFLDSALGSGLAASVPGLPQDQNYLYLQRMLGNATTVYDHNPAPGSGGQVRPRYRSIDFILKDIHRRGRPYQTMDGDGNFIPGYTGITGSSFPSGHSWKGYKQAALLAMMFPERGEEIYSRALQYAESRVILGVHFATDTIASRIGMYYTTAQMLADDQIASAIVLAARAARAPVEGACGMPLRACLAATPSSVADDYRSQNDRVGYYGAGGGSSAAPLSPDALPEESSYLLRLRFPYLKYDDWRNILAGTAYPQDSLAAWLMQPGQSNSTWGLLNVPAAYRGPAYLYRDMEVDQQSGTPYDIAGLGQLDVWKNDIAGPGGLIKRGDGTLVLTGNNTYAGPTVINGGRLNVNGSLASGVSVNANGVLGGSGSIGNISVMAGGTLSPGNPVGRLRISNNITFEPGSSYQVHANANGQSGSISADTLTIRGGTVTVQADQGHYNRHTRYVIAQANQRSGMFSGATSNFAFLTPSLDYTSTDVLLTLSRNRVKYAAVATTRNQRSVAQALDAMTPHAGATVINTLDSLSASQAQNALSSLSGTGLASSSRMGSAFSNDIGNQLRGRLATITPSMRGNGAALNAPVMLAANDSVDEVMQSLRQQRFSLAGEMPGAHQHRGGFWMRGFGGQQSTGGDGNNAASRLRGTGMSAGFDTDVTDKLIAGVAIMQGTSMLNTDDNLSGKSRGTAAALYAGYVTGNWTLNASATLARNNTHTQRQLVFGPVAQSATADFGSRSTALHVDATYDLPMSGWIMRPLLGLSWTRSAINGFTESGAPGLDLRVNARREDSVKTVVGAIAVLKAGAVQLQPRLLWSHEVGNINAPLTSQFQTSPVAFSSYGADIPRDTIIGGFMVSGQAHKNVSLFADVQSEYNSRRHTFGFLVGTRLAW